MDTHQDRFIFIPCTFKYSHVFQSVHNPVKRVGLEAYGLEIVENVPVETVPNPYNERYLRTKKERMGHTLHFNK